VPIVRLSDCEVVVTTTLAVQGIVRSGSEPNFDASPIRANWILEGNLIARIELLSSSAAGTASSYFWDCTPGRFNWFYDLMKRSTSSKGR